MSTLKENIERVEGFLREKELVYTKSENILTVPYEIGDLVFNPQIEFHGKWLTVSACMIKNENVPEAIRCDLYRELLTANNKLPEIQYDIDEEGNVNVSADMRIAITDFDNFFSEFFSIPYGIKYFVENIAPKFNLNMKAEEK